MSRKPLPGRPSLLWVILLGFLSACGGGNGGNDEISNQEFLSRILMSGDTPDQWNYIWNCQVTDENGGGV